MTEDEALQLYRQLLLRWSDRVNLIGPEARENLDAHIAEAVAAAKILEPAGEVMDVGSGGGLPAIPMAIVSPAARVHLVEADQKKWAFLKHVVRECELNSQVHGDRLARVLAGLNAEVRFSLVTSRAVGRPEQWLPGLLPFLTPDGHVALFQGSPEAPAIEGTQLHKVVPLPRGQSNYLVILKMFHVEQHG
jgi:16S rRNA (guanine527-N7)-methyltransferase